jgi:hypothetical protein
MTALQSAAIDGRAARWDEAWAADHPLALICIKGTRSFEARAAQSWRLKGPLTAMSGILIFGWSSAVLFKVLRTTIEHLASIVAPGEPFSSANQG